MKFETVLRDDQRKHRKFLRFPMECQLEAVPQKSLKQARFDSNSLVILLDIVELTQLLSYVAGRFRSNLVSFGFEPLWGSKDPSIFDLVGLLDEKLHCGAACLKRSGRKPAKFEHSACVLVWFDRRDLERWRSGAGALGL